jgi:hypothetical protein
VFKDEVDEFGAVPVKFIESIDEKEEPLRLIRQQLFERESKLRPGPRTGVATK